MSGQEQQLDDPVAIVNDLNWREKMVALGNILRTQASELSSLRAEVERLKAEIVMKDFASA